MAVTGFWPIYKNLKAMLDYADNPDKASSITIICAKRHAKRNAIRRLSASNISVREIKKAIKEVDAAIENLWKGIEQGQSVDMLTEHLHKRQAEKEELETQLAIENNKKICLSEAQILAFLDYVCEMPFDDFNKRRAIINIFVKSIYLYDDHFTLIINASKKPLSIDNIPLDDIEEAFEGENTETEGCSSLMTPAPPRKQSRKWLLFLISGNRNRI